jgi:hypothetical protein
MIHATNCAIIGLEGIEKSAEHLEAKLSLGGKRASATVKDILPTNDDNTHMLLAFQGLIAESLVLYCPGSQDWKDRTEMLKQMFSHLVYLMLMKDRRRESLRF